MAYSPNLPEPTKDQPLVFLLGFMGAGKSTLGKMAARKLDWQFIDLDDEIERSEGKKISSIFAASGERYFRQLERHTLEEGVRKLDRPTLFSLGGGTPCHLDTMEWIKEQGMTLYLKVPTPILVGRLRIMRATRPMLSRIPEEELPQFIEQLLKQREPYYLRAHIICENCTSDRNGIVQVVQDSFPNLPYPHA